MGCNMLKKWRKFKSKTRPPDGPGVMWETFRISIMIQIQIDLFEGFCYILQKIL